MRVLIVGAGMAGLSCARALRDAGRTVRLLDKGRAAGGRMSSRRLPTPARKAGFDHGARYFTAPAPAPGFRAQAGRWRAAGLVVPWPAAEPG